MPNSLPILAAALPILYVFVSLGLQSTHKLSLEFRSIHVSIYNVSVETSI